MTRRPLAWLVACALPVLAGTAPQQTPPPQDPPGQRQIFRSEANLVRVDIHVLQDGRPVMDLTRDDFQLLEDGVPQRLESFEYLRAEGARSTVAAEPSSTEAALELASDPRHRVFILVLDTLHVTEMNSLQIPMPLVRLLDRLLAPTDLIGVMTPEMEFRDLILGRKTDVIRRGLLQQQRWGRMVENCRSIHVLDDNEKMYTACYPSHDVKCDISQTAMELILRRREAFTLGVLSDLVRSIGARREARTSFLLVTEGWRLLKRNERMSNAGAARTPQITIGRGGRLGTSNPDNFNVESAECDRHLRAAADRDNERAFRDLIDEANRNNASFYIVDPGGLRVAGGHEDALRTLADNTDGNTVVNTNDLAGGLQRLVDDLSGYYLVGYYSSNTRADGRYRRIEVKVSRPGVDVRSRKGYRAWTAEEMKAIEAARAAAPAPPPKVDPSASARTAALGRLARLAPGTAAHFHGSVHPDGTTLYVSGELAGAAARSSEWNQGGEAQIIVTAAGGSSETARATIPAGARGFLARVSLPSGASRGGEYEIAVRLRPVAGGTPAFETFRVGGAGAGLGEPIAFRSNDRTKPVATFLWYRTEPLRVEVPASRDASAPTARLLDRAGNPVAVPVNATMRDAGSERWVDATLNLGAVAPGDYTLELTVEANGRTTRRYMPLRVER